MIKQAGYLINEIIILIIILGILATTILVGISSALRSAPDNINSTKAAQIANRCMEWFIGQRQLSNFATITCPSSVIPAFCTSQAGFTVAVDISCATISGDNTYKIVTTTVSGSGVAEYTTLLASY